MDGFKSSVDDSNDSQLRFRWLKANPGREAVLYTLQPRDLPVTSLCHSVLYILVFGKSSSALTI